MLLLLGLLSRYSINRRYSIIVQYEIQESSPNPGRWTSGIIITFCALFSADFACALVSDILLQGTLYITPNFFAFYSKIFGHVSRLLIPVSQVASVQKERTAKIIPNAVGLHMVDGKSYVFGSLLSRDSTYKLMNHILKKAQQIGDSDSEPPSAVQVAVDDDGEDSVSASAESLMEEDQADGFLATSPVVDLVGVTATTTTPWIRDGCTATTTSSITSSSNTTATASTISTAGIPGHNLPGSPNCTTVLRRGSLSSSKAGTEEPGGAGGGSGGGVGVLFEWFTQGSLVKTCFKVGSIPVKLIGEGVKELWSLPRTSILLIISTLLLLLLFASAAFMLHRVDVLSQQLGLEKYDEYNGMYEEVLQMQQRLHAAASSEIEKTLSIQLKHIATVRQSLEALVVLFNKEPPVSTAQIPDNT
ncbi:GRAM domain-containing protein 2B-like [Penaeus indicus]|uniref:GRAM domain-containing protein 2B-like n=1 Tax=Penaeus indicus TaxID=29960 RepID=UPI00300CB173